MKRLVGWAPNGSGSDARNPRFVCSTSSSSYEPCAWSQDLTPDDLVKTSRAHNDKESQAAAAPASPTLFVKKVLDQASKQPLGFQTRIVNQQRTSATKSLTTAYACPVPKARISVDLRRLQIAPAPPTRASPVSQLRYSSDKPAATASSNSRPQHTAGFDSQPKPLAVTPSRQPSYQPPVATTYSRNNLPAAIRPQAQSVVSTLYPGPRTGQLAAPPGKPQPWPATTVGNILKALHVIDLTQAEETADTLPHPSSLHPNPGTQLIPRPAPKIAPSSRHPGARSVRFAHKAEHNGYKGGRVSEKELAKPVGETNVSTPRRAKRKRNGDGEYGDGFSSDDDELLIQLTDNVEAKVKAEKAIEALGMAMPPPPRKRPALAPTPAASESATQKPGLVVIELD